MQYSRKLIGQFDVGSLSVGERGVPHERRHFESPFQIGSPGQPQSGR